MTEYRPARAPAIVTRCWAYYNEIDPYCCQWLRNLIKARLIMDGDVDERGIRDVQGEELRAYRRCHFFAGIGGWDLALRLARWPNDRPVWTGSCPCQPFSAAGKRRAYADERHLWPAFYRLIQECRPATVFGEQVASADVLGKAGGIAPHAPEPVWLDGVRVDLEAARYTFGAVDLPAASVGSPHIRQRAWWVVNAKNGARERAVVWGNKGEHSREFGDGLAESLPAGRTERRTEPLPARSAEHGGLGDTERVAREPGRLTVGPTEGDRAESERPYAEPGRSGNAGFWDRYDLIPCLDGKSRRVEPGSFPLAHGIPARVGKLRAYGNAIVPRLAAEFIQSYMEVTA